MVPGLGPGREGELGVVGDDPVVQGVRMHRQGVPEGDALIIRAEFDIQSAQGRVVLREMQDDAPIRIPDLAALPERIVPHGVPGNGLGACQRKIVEPAVQAGYGALSGRHFPDVVVHGQVQGRRKHHGAAVEGRGVSDPRASVFRLHLDPGGLTTVRRGDVEGLRAQGGPQEQQDGYDSRRAHHSPW